MSGEYFVYFGGLLMFVLFVWVINFLRELIVDVVKECNQANKKG